MSRPALRRRDQAAAEGAGVPSPEDGTASAARFTFGAPLSLGGRLDTTADVVRGAFNGIIGGYLGETRNPFAEELSFRHRGAPLPLSASALKAAFPHASGRLVIFVHGLSCTEHAWALYSRRHWPNSARPQHYGRLLAQRGFTPLYVRYNTGSSITTNGKALAAQIRELAQRWPVPVARVVLIGHGMGGLVVRSAAHYAHRRRHQWIDKLDDLIALGAPTDGASLQTLGTVMAGVVSGFRRGEILAELLNSGDAVLRELGFGYLRGADQEGAPPGPAQRHRATRVPGKRYHFIGSSHAEPDAPLGVVLGDGLVQLTARAAAEHADADQAFLAQLHHMQLLNHAQVYQLVERILLPPRR